MDLKDFVEAGVFEPGSRAYEKVMQDEVDQAVERNKTIKGAKKALNRIKTRESIENMPRDLLGTSGLRSVMGKADSAVKSYFSKRGITDSMSEDQVKAILKEGSFKKGGSVMARGCKMGRNKATKIY